MSFGRKGVVPGAGGAASPAVRAGGPRPAMPKPARAAAPAEDTYASQREAFLAAERERKAASGEWQGHPDEEVAIPYPRREPSSGKHGMFGAPERRNLFIAYIFWFAVGQASMHRFYCGQKQTALMQIGLGVGSLAILLIFPPLGMVGVLAWAGWLFADLFLIPGMLRRFKAEHRSDYEEVFA